MKNRTRLNEIIVGAFVLLAFILLIGMTFVIKGSTGPGSYELLIEYEDVVGLDIGSPVLVAGFRRGQVVDMQAELNRGGKPTVIVKVRVAPTIPIYKDASAALKQQGFIGDKQIEIDPGTQSAGEVGKRDTIKGIAFYDFTKAFDGTGAMIEDLHATIRNLKTITSDEGRLAKVDEVLANLASSTRRMDAMLEQNETGLREAIANVRQLSERSVAVAERADQVMVNAETIMGEVSEEVSTTLSEFRATANSIRQRLDGVLERAESVGTNADLLLADGRVELERMSKTLRETSENLNALLGDINAGRGTVGRLVKDPRPFEDLQESMAALRKALLETQDSFYDRTLPYRAGQPVSQP